MPRCGPSSPIGSGSAVLLLLLSASPPLALAQDPLAGVPPSLRVGPTGKALQKDEIARLGKGEILTALIDDPANPVKKGVAVGVVDGPPEKVFATVGDYEHFTDFMPYIEKAVVDKRDGRTSTVSYWLAFPLNIGNRHYQLEVTDGQRAVDGVHVYASDWKYTGTGNITDTTGSWEISPWGDGKRSFVRYVCFTDPGGSLPTWVKNMAASSALPKVMKAVRSRVASPQARAYVPTPASLN
jgi:hypothetical protein